MTPSEARSVLGVGDAAKPDEIRAAFRAQIGVHHPDVNPAAETSAQALRLIEAWEVLSGSSQADAAQPAASAPPESDDAEPQPDGPQAAEAPAAWATGASVMAAAPADETMLWLVDAAHRIGDVTFLDLSAGLVEALVEFVDGPTVTLTLSLQGRGALQGRGSLRGRAATTANSTADASGTEVFISMEPWSTPPRPDLPDDQAVAHLLAHHLREAAEELGPQPE